MIDLDDDDAAGQGDARAELVAHMQLVNDHVHGDDDARVAARVDELRARDRKLIRTGRIYGGIFMVAIWVVIIGFIAHPESHAVKLALVAAVFVLPFTLVPAHLAMQSRFMPADLEAYVREELGLRPITQSEAEKLRSLTRSNPDFSYYLTLWAGGQPGEMESPFTKQEFDLLVEADRLRREVEELGGLGADAELRPSKMLMEGLDHRGAREPTNWDTVSNGSHT